MEELESRKQYGEAWASAIKALARREHSRHELNQKLKGRFEADLLEEVFEALAETEIGSFYLTDYLARHFDRLIIQGLGIDRHPELQEMYFGNYKKLVYLAQTEDSDLKALALAAAERLNLAFEYHFTGYGGLGRFIETHIDLPSTGQTLEAPAWQS